MPRGRRSLLFLLAFASSCLAQPRGEGLQDFRIRLDVKRVPLYVTVRDSNGKIVEGLDQLRFSVLQDERLQEVREFRTEDVPIAVGLVLDNSGSMLFKAKQVLAAANAFMEMRAASDEFFVVHFNSKVTFGLPQAVPFSRNRELLTEALHAFQTTGPTALYDAAYEALKHAETSALPKKVLILISDGGDTSSRRQASEVFDLADRSGALVYSIGLYDKLTEIRSPGKLRRLSNRTGGEAYFPKTTEEVVEICKQIAQDLRRQYTLVYSPNNPPGDKQYHRIRVLVRGAPKEQLRVRNRTGYYADGSLGK